MKKNKTIRSNLSIDMFWKQLGFIRDARNSQDSVLWTIFNTFWASNAVLLVALFSTGKLPNKEVGVIISIVGALLSIAWSLIQIRTIEIIKRFEDIGRKLERDLKIPSKYSISYKREKYTTRGKIKNQKNINSIEKNNIILKIVPRSRNIMKVCCILASTLWLLAIYLFAK